MSETIEADFIIPFELGESRIDQALAELMPEHSRSRIQGWIKDGQVTINGQGCRPKDKVTADDVVSVHADIELIDHWCAEDIPLDIVYEDEDILVINKPVGMVVHPAPGNPSGTLVNALLGYLPDIAMIPRAGVVHRLDKDTSGLLVVAKTLTAHSALVEQLQERSMGREYEAIVVGVMTGGGLVEEPIARHPKDRKKMAVHPFGKEAITHYRVLERFTANTHIRVKLETGRTHQIRVHMAHIAYPLVGDAVYCGRPRIPAGVSQSLKDAVRGFGRQALHARQLTLWHPATGEEMSWEVSLAQDMQELLALLRAG